MSKWNVCVLLYEVHSSGPFLKGVNKSILCCPTYHKIYCISQSVKKNTLGTGGTYVYRYSMLYVIVLNYNFIFDEK